MKNRIFAVVVAFLAALSAVAVGAAPASAIPDPVANTAAAWLRSQQQPDGGFEVAGFPGFETPDAVLAIASAAQTGGFSKAVALAAIEKPVGTPDALDTLDDFVDAGISAGQAAKLIALVVAPLGLDATDFDPRNNSAEPVNLVAKMLSAAGPDDSYSSLGSAFNAKLYVVLGLSLTGRPVPASLVSAIRTAQQANGSWSFNGSPAGSDFDADSTGLAIQALVVAGADAKDANVSKALIALAVNQKASGAWQSFGSDDPNSTSVAVLGITAAGGDVDSPCWRNTVRPAALGTAYASPLAWLRTQQAGDGHIKSPNDPPVNTFATSQTIQALTRAWLPISSASTITCSGSGGGSGSNPGNGNGSTSPTAVRNFVETAYLTILGRAADEGGAKFFTDRILAGATRSSVARKLAGNNEYRNRFVTQRFDQFLGTKPTVDDLSRLGALIRAGKRLDAEAQILASDAFFTKAGGTNAGFVAAVYKQVLGRAPEAASQAAWVAALESGASRLTVTSAIVKSGEARSFLVKGLYQTYLGRPGDAGGVEFWRNKIGKGTSVETVIAALVGSNEFFQGL